jgi:hypothetical protein
MVFHVWYALDPGRSENPDCLLLFSDGESPYANKAGWHTAPFAGYGYDLQGVDNNEVFWLAPSLDWQTGTPSRTWVVSASWLAYGMHAYKQYEQARASQVRPVVARPFAVGTCAGEASPTEVLLA